VSDPAAASRPARRLAAVLAQVPRLGLGLLFVVAGWNKLLDPAGLAQEIANYQLFPATAPYLAIALPTSEMVAGLALLLGPPPWRAAGASAIGLLLLVFTGAVVSALLRGLDIDCACFGTGSGSVTWLTFVRNLGLLAAAATALAVEFAPWRGRIAYTNRLHEM
jgi:putative oxidoreductase